MRNTDLIIKEIKELVNAKGYIYAVCLILFEDFHVDLETIHKIDHKSKLSVKEASLILGFIVQNTIDFSIPNSPESVIELKDKTYSLMEELHFSFSIPQMGKIKKRALQAKNGIHIEDNYSERFDFFVNDGGMVEPMFYAGDGVYEFQYLEYLESKYKYDKEWLLEKKSFDVQNAIKLVSVVKEILHEKSKRVNLVGLREIIPQMRKEAKKVLKRKYREEDFKKVLISAEFYQYKELFPFPPISDDINESIRSENWSRFYENLFDLFVVTKSQLKSYTQSDSFIENFSFIPGGDINKDYKGPGYFNIINSKPIIQIDEDRFFIPISFLVAEAVYESPYYWMCEDKEYLNSLAEHRGVVGEEMAYELLSKVFGTKNTFKSVIVTTLKGHQDTDIDVLCILGSKALCVQVKSKKLTLSAKRGDTEQLIKDFKGSVQDAYNQGLTSRSKILEKKAKFFDNKKREIALSEDITDVYIMGITTENYPALTHQAYIMLEKKQTDPYPIFLSIFDLELLTHYLNDPYDFLYYVRQRIALMDYFRADEEMAYLGYHLKNKLWPVDNADLVSIDTDYGGIIDRNYYPLKTGYDHLVTISGDPIKNLWKDEHFDRLCSDIKRLKLSQVTDIIFHLLDWSEDSRSELVANIINAKKQTFLDRRTRIITTAATDFGVCYVALDTNDREILRNRLLNYSMAWKYRRKCNVWLGIGSLVDTPHMIDYLVYNDELWKNDMSLEALASQLLDSKIERTTIFPNKRQIGRNDICPCGSGLKFKRCCGKNMN